MIQKTRRFFGALGEELVEIHFAAASLSYSTLLSIIPFLVIVLAVFQSNVGLEKFFPRIEDWMTTYLKENAGSLASDFIHKTLASVRPQAMGITGAIFLCLTSMSLIRSVDTAFHKLWKIKSNRPIHRRIWFYWVFLMALPVALALIVGLQSVAYFDRVNTTLEHSFQFSIWSTLTLWILYTLVPSMNVNKIASLISAVTASFILNITQDGFIMLSVSVFRKNKVYGSIASFPIFLLWLLVVWCVILAGVSLCSVLQQRIFKR